MYCLYKAMTSSPFNRLTPVPPINPHSDDAARHTSVPDVNGRLNLESNSTELISTAGEVEAEQSPTDSISDQTGLDSEIPSTATDSKGKETNDATSTVNAGVDTEASHSGETGSTSKETADENDSKSDEVADEETVKSSVAEETQAELVERLLREIVEKKVTNDIDKTKNSARTYFELTRRMHRLYQNIVSDEYNDVLLATADALYINSSFQDKDDRRRFADSLVQLGIVELCQHVCTVTRERLQKPTKESGEEKEEDVEKAQKKRYLKSRTSHCILVVSLNLTDYSASACKRVLDIELYKDLLALLREMSTESYEEASYYMGILYNTIQLNGEARELYRDENAVETIQKYRTVDDSDVSSLALVLLAYVINEDENDMLGSDGSSFAFFASELRMGISRAHHRSYSGWKVIELLTAINKLAVSDANKEHILESEALTSYVRLLTGSRSDTDEIHAAAQGIWSLALSCPERVLKVDGCVDGLKKVLETTDNDGIQRQARGALEALGIVIESPKVLSNTPAAREASSNVGKSLASAGHVFISYNHKAATTCLRLRDRLRAAGFAVWIDADQLCESVTEEIIKGLDAATAVLVCMSQKYYESPYCKKEFMYAADNNKVIVPLIVENRYKPHGWLKFHFTDNFWIDISREEVFEDSFKKLQAALMKTYQPILDKVNQMTDEVDGLLTVNETSTGAHGAIPAAPEPTNVSNLTTTTSPPSSDYKFQPQTFVMQPPLEGAKLWTVNDVSTWLQKNGLQNLRDWFAGYDGTLLSQFKYMRRDSPETFAIGLQNEMKAGRLSLHDIPRLNNALDTLGW